MAGHRVLAEQQEGLNAAREIANLPTRLGPDPHGGIDEDPHEIIDQPGRMILRDRESGQLWVGTGDQNSSDGYSHHYTGRGSVTFDREHWVRPVPAGNEDDGISGHYPTTERGRATA